MRMSALKKFFLLFFVFFHAIDGKTLYDDQDSWATNSPSCATDRQSPIALETSKAKKDDKTLKINWKRENSKMTIEIKNIGDAVTFTSDNLAANLDLDKVNYKFAFLKYHWGDDESGGSEHTVDGTRYSGEIEFVHYRADLKSYDEAKDEPDGIVILSRLLQEDATLENDIKEIKDFTYFLKDVKKSGSAKMIKFDKATLSMEKMIPNDKSYFRYLGSFSYPPCTGNVDRIVFKEPLLVTSSFLKALRGLQSDDDTNIQKNFRKIQDNKGITVYTAEAQT